MRKIFMTVKCVRVMAKSNQRSAFSLQQGTGTRQVWRMDMILKGTNYYFADYSCKLIAIDFVSSIRRNTHIHFDITIHDLQLKNYKEKVVLKNVEFMKN